MTEDELRAKIAQGRAMFAATASGARGRKTLSYVQAVSLWQQYLGYKRELRTPGLRDGERREMRSQAAINLRALRRAGYHATERDLRKVVRKARRR